MTPPCKISSSFVPPFPNISSSDFFLFQLNSPQSHQNNLSKTPLYRASLALKLVLASCCLCDKVQTTKSGIQGPPKATPTQFHSPLTVHLSGPKQSLYRMPQIVLPLPLWAFLWPPLPCALQLLPKFGQPAFLFAFHSYATSIKKPPLIPKAPKWVLLPLSSSRAPRSSQETYWTQPFLVMEVSELPQGTKAHWAQKHVDGLNVPQQKGLSKHLYNTFHWKWKNEPMI